MRLLRERARQGKRWIVKRSRFRLVGRPAVSSKRTHDMERGAYNVLPQDSDAEWFHEAAKIYLQAWVVSWHQLHNEDAKEVALWSYEDLESIAATQAA